MTKAEIEKQIHDFALRINSMGFLDGYSKGLNDRKKEIEKAKREGYDEGVTDTIFNTDTYKQGLNDAWECARKILADVVDGGFDSDTLKQIFGTPIISDVFKINSASEAIAKIKEYEEQQKPKFANCSILNDECAYPYITCDKCEVHCSIARARQKLKGDKE